MTNFDESKHPRGNGGQFTEKTHSDPTIDLASMNWLTVDQSAAGPLAYSLAESGLTGTVTKYEGYNQLAATSSSRVLSDAGQLAADVGGTGGVYGVRGAAHRQGKCSAPPAWFGEPVEKSLAPKPRAG